MIRILSSLLALLILAAPSLAAKKTDKFKAKKESRMKVIACQKACIPAHDAQLAACKKDGACMAKADEERAACELTCRTPKAKPAEAKPAEAKPAETPASH